MIHLDDSIPLQQESISVECVPDRLLIVSRSIPCIPRVLTPPGVDTHPSPCEQTHTYENITFPQLRLRAVIIEIECFKKYHKSYSHQQEPVCKPILVPPQGL